MQPEHGARFTLRLVAASPVVAYRLTVELGGSVVQGQASVDPANGDVAIESDAELPEWLSNTVTRLLRSLWRDRQQNPHTGWPRRLTRWRQAEQTRQQ